MSEVIPVSRCTAYPVLAIIGAAIVLSACSLLPFPDKQQPSTEQVSDIPLAEDVLQPAITEDSGVAEVLPMTAKTASESTPPVTDQQELHIVPVMADGDQPPSQIEALDEAAQQVAESIPPNTFLITSAPKDKSHLYYGVGSPLGLAVNDSQGKELVVVRGESYTFKVDTGVQHDFYLSLSDKGWGAATLTDGVKGNYTYKGVVVFEPGKNTPDVVFYQCRNHKSMGSKIHVVDKGKESSVVFGVRDDVSPSKSKSKTTFTTATQAEQKVKFADMFIAMSPAAKRIDSSDHVEAKQLLAQARARLDDAKTSLAKGENEQTISIADDALRKMSAASQLVPSETQMAELQAKYQELLRGTQDFEKSYRRNFSLMKKKGKKDLPDLDIELMSKMIADAQKLADNNEFNEATKQLQKVQRDITRALSSLLSDETMDYTLVFANAKEEYEYELSRYKSYDELVPIAIEQKQPPKQTLALMDQFVEKARSIYALSGPKATEGDYKTAIQMLQGATSHLQRALRIVGVR